MVTRNRHTILCFTLLVLCISLFSAFVTSTQAQVTYTVNKEWVRIWINGDGSTDIQYNITLTYLSGSPQGIVTVGMPKGGFQINYVENLSGSSLQFNDVSQGDFYGIDVYLTQPIILDRSNTFLVYATIPGMVSPDTTNPGNVGMLVYPSTFQSTIATRRSVEPIAFWKVLG